MAKYQHTSGEVVDAVQFKPLPQGTAWPNGVTSWDGHPGGQPRDMSWGFVETPEGRRHVMANDWILTDASGKHRVRGPSVFATDYKPCACRTTTDRGFAIYDEFVDHYGHKVRVQQSSCASVPTVWIFSQEHPDEVGLSIPHLTVEQAKRVRDALDTFIAESS